VGGGFGFADQKADAGAVDACGGGGGGLGEDDAGRAGGGDVGDGAEVERETADVDGGSALGLADDVGDGDALGAEAFGDADGPVAADFGAGGRELGEDAAGGGGGGVEAVLDGDVEAGSGGFVDGFGDGLAGEVGDFDLAAVDGEAEGDEGREEGDGEHGQGADQDVKESPHG